MNLIVTHISTLQHKDTPEYGHLCIKYTLLYPKYCTFSIYIHPCIRVTSLYRTLHQVPKVSTIRTGVPLYTEVSLFQGRPFRPYRGLRSFIT